MNHTVYLPDVLGEWAKASGLNLSGLLRDAVEHRRRLANEHADNAALADAMKRAETIELTVEDNDGRNYVLEFVGVPLGDDGIYYLAEDGRILAWDESKLRVDVIDDLDDLRHNMVFNEYVDAMNMLGKTPRVSLEEFSA